MSPFMTGIGTGYWPVDGPWRRAVWYDFACRPNELEEHAAMSDDRDQVISARANLWRGAESVGGQLTLDSGVLSFRAHALNVQTEALDLRTADIESTRKYRSMGFIPNGLAVTTISGAEYRFVVGQRDRFIAGIEASRQAG